MTNPSQPSPFSPPPPPQSPAPVTAPAIGWLVPLSALFAVIGLFTPWFNPTGTKDGVKILQAESPLHAWEDGKIGLIPPILLVVVAIGVVALIRGRSVSRFNSARGPVFAAGRTAIIAGAVTIVAVVVAWFFVPNQFSKVPADAGGSWDGAAKLGISMSRGPQLGYWLTVIAGVLAVVGGVLMILMRSRAATPDQSMWAPAGQSPAGRPVPDAAPAGLAGQVPAWGQPGTQHGDQPGGQSGPAWGQPSQQPGAGPVGQAGPSAPYGSPDGQQSGRHGA